MLAPLTSRQTVVRYLFVVLVMAVVLATANSAFACPTCKDGMGVNDPSAQAMARGYFYSILFMMAMPFVLVGTFGGAAYLSIRRARERQGREDLDRSDETSY